MPRAPVLFVSHGAPTFALEPGLLGPQLNALGQQIKDVKAVLVVSPHWQTRGVHVGTSPAPKTVHDFGGFPAPLYALHYNPPGAPELAQATGQLLTQAGWPVREDAARGLDHGAWVPLLHLLPFAPLPVFQVSMPFDLTPATALALGRALAPLREQGVLILASGSMTHNLHDVFQGDGRSVPYADAFTRWVRQAVTTGAVDDLLAYRERAPEAVRAHPTDEHFLPLFVALGALASETPNEKPQVLLADTTYGVLSMESYAWGMPSPVEAQVAAPPSASLQA